MRRSLSVAAGVLGVVVILGTAAAQTSQPDRATRSGWWWVAQTNQGSTPVTGVKSDEIAVARQGNGETEQAAVWFDVSDVTNPPDRVIMRLRHVSDSRRGGGGGILACPLTRAWTEADGGAWSQRPTPDCSNAVGASQAGPDGYWTFDVTPLVWEWASGSRVNNGIGLYASQSNLNPSYEIVLGDLQGGDVAGLRDGSTTTTTAAPTTTTVAPTTTTTSPPPTPPTVPPAPEAPATPEAPEVPGAPSTPDTPAGPDAPEVPSDIPTAPGGEVPVLPEAPGGPEVPGAPVTPPSDPGTDPGSEVPTWMQWLMGVFGDPALPTNDLPPAPGTPTLPGSPGGPGSPEAPGVPAAPGGPDLSSIPSVDPDSPLTSPATPPAPPAPSAPPAPPAPSGPDDPDQPGTPPADTPSNPGSGGGTPSGSSGGGWMSPEGGDEVASAGYTYDGSISEGSASSEGSVDQSSLPKTNLSGSGDEAALGAEAATGSDDTSGAPWGPIGAGVLTAGLVAALAALQHRRRLTAR